MAEQQGSAREASRLKPCTYTMASTAAAFMGTAVTAVLGLGLATTCEGGPEAAKPGLGMREKHFFISWFAVLGEEECNTATATGQQGVPHCLCATGAAAEGPWLLAQLPAGAHCWLWRKAWAVSGLLGGLWLLGGKGPPKRMKVLLPHEEGLGSSEVNHIPTGP